MTINIDDLREENIRRYGEDTKHLDIYKNMYTSEMHFIDEILQNAEDAGASQIHFELKNDKLKIFHNGKDFSDSDIKGICNISESSKSEGTIGKFGFGFKSVYTITNVPEIYNKNIAFRIESYVRPYSIPNKVIETPYTTLFIFPFIENKCVELIEKIYDRLVNFDVRNLLFLHKIKKISYKLNDNKEGSYSKKTKNNVITISDINGKSESWLLFSKAVSSKQNVDVAYKFENSKIIPIQNAKLFIYFQTDKPTGLKFLINGPFNSSPTRDNIKDIKDDKQNQKLLSQIADLIVDSIEEIKNKNLLNVEFLKVLPIETNVFRPKYYGQPAWDVLIYDKIKEGLLTKKWVPTHNGKFTSLNSALLARNMEIAKLYSIQNKSWVSSEISYDKTRELWDYISDECNVEIITPEKFIKKIDENLVAGKSNNWFIKLYSFLANLKSQWDNLKTKPIIKLENGDIVIPFDRGKLDVFISSKYQDNDIKLVAKDILKNKEALSFLRDFGIKEFDCIDYIINSFYKKYNKSTSDINFNENQKDITKLAEIFEKASDDDRKRIIDLLKDIPFIRCQNIKNDIAFKTIEDVYIRNQITEKYFSENSNIWYPHFQYTSEIISLLKELGVSEYPKLIINKTVDKPQRQGSTRSITNYDIDGLQEFIKNISKDTSYLLWQIVSNLYAKNDDIFEATRSYFHYINKSEKYPSIIFNLLTESDWILTQNGLLKKTCEVSFEELPNQFKEMPNAKEIAQKLKFKIDEISQIEQKTGGKFIPKEELPEYEKWKRQQENNTTSTNWEPECNPEDIDVEPQIFKSYSLGCVEGIRPKKTNFSKKIDIKENIPEDITASSSILNDEDIKKIGRWGEEFVKSMLKKEYPSPEYNIIDLNQDTCGIGYDFDIEKNGETIVHIEVKTTTHSFMGEINVSGNQWKLAQKYYNEGKGDKYHIYIVSDAGTKNAKIIEVKNPVKMWKEGKLDAHPVNLIINI